MKKNLVLTLAAALVVSVLVVQSPANAFNYPWHKKPAAKVAPVVTAPVAAPVVTVPVVTPVVTAPVVAPVAVIKPAIAAPKAPAAKIIPVSNVQKTSAKVAPCTKKTCKCCPKTSVKKEVK